MHSNSQSSRSNSRRFRTFFLGIALLAIGACGSGDPEPQLDGEMPEFAPELNVDISAMQRADSGLLTRDLEVGEGETARVGELVTVHYTGWLPDGTSFDSSRDRGPFQFQLGVGQVIPGWDLGVDGMKVGGRRQLVIPSDLAYGPNGVPGVIPPNSVLVFDVELLGVGS